MSTMQWSVAIAVAAVIALVFAINAWQAHRSRRRLEAASAAVAARAEKRAVRIEPTIAPAFASSGAGPADPAGHDAAAPGGVVAGEAVATDVSSPSRAATDPPPGGTGAPARSDGEAGAGGAATEPRHAALDPNIDCIVEIELEAPQPGERLVAVTRVLRRVGSKPVLFEGHDVASNEWRALEPRGAFGALRCGVLMANRHGPLNAMEFSELAAGLQPIAEQLDSLVHLPDMSMVLDRARQLDERCAELDAQVGLNIESAEPPTVADLQACAESNGLAERGNNLYAKLGDDGEVLFSLALGDTINRLTLLLDVPRAPATRDPWRQMVDCAVTCAARLSGRIVDDGGRALDLAALERIEEQLAERWTALAQAGMPAGSPAALRLFN